MLRTVIVGFALALALCAARPARAVHITWVFDGTLECIGGTAPSPALQSLGVEIGAPVHGFLRFQSNTPPSATSNANGGQY